MPYIPRKKVIQRDQSDVDIIQRFFGYSANVAIDIGANVGDYTEQFAQQATLVIAIEPHPDNLTTLRNRFKYQRNIQILNVAIANMEGSRKLYISGNRGGHTIAELLVNKAICDHKPDRFIVVPVTKLDTIAKNLDVDLIKIDVEAAEEEVLMSGLETLKRCHPRIMLETHQTSNFFAIHNLLKALNYTVYLNNTQVENLEQDRNYECK